MNRADNIRSRNTERKMEEVYLRLLAENPGRQVSVIQVCSHAKVNRTTFYAHYQDIFDLQRHVEKRISEEVSAIFRDKGYGEHRITRERFSVLIEYIRQNRLFYRAWYNSGRMDEPSSMEMVLNRPHITDSERFRIIFYKAGITAIIRDWVLRDCKESNEQMLSILSEIYQW